MSFLKELFKTEKPIIGLLHLKPLPGDPFYAPGGSMDDVIACARADLDALQKGGVDGVLVTNELSLPYEKKVSGVTLGAMGMVVGALREQFRVPFGVEAIYDGDATMELCAATEADFTRCLFTGAGVRLRPGGRRGHGAVQCHPLRGGQPQPQGDRMAL